MMSDSVMFVFFCFSCRVSETEFSDTTLVTKVMKCGQATLVEQVEGSKQEELQVERYEDQGTYYEDYGETYGADYAMAVSDSNSTLVEKGNDIIVLLVGLTGCPLSQDCMWMTRQIC